MRGVGTDWHGRTIPRSSPSTDAVAESRRRLHEILNDDALDYDARLTALLDLGCERLGVDNAHLAHVDPESDTHEVLVATGSDLVTAGATRPLDETFCKETVQRDDLLVVGDAAAGDWPAPTEDLPCRCYVGRRLEAHGELFGTLCFLDRDAYPTWFGPEQRTFVDLLARTVSQLLERELTGPTFEPTHELFETLVDEVTNYAIALLDPGGYVATWNAGAETLLGYETEAVCGEHLSRFYPQQAKESGVPERLLDRARRTGRAEDEGLQVRADGSQFWALVSVRALRDDDGDLQGFGVVTQDLTERREMRRALAAEEELTEQALNTLDDLFFVLDTDGTIRRTNAAVPEVTGYDTEAVLSRDPTMFFAPADRHDVERAIERALDEGEATVEAALVTRGGERRQYEFRGRRLTDGEEVTGVVGIGRDISQRTLYEERLEVAQRVLRHNLRNDLNVIRGWAETVAASGEAEQAADRIIDTADDLIELSEKTRLMAELDSPSADGEAVAACDLVGDLLAEFQDRYPGASFDAAVPTANTVYLPDDDRLRIALRNAVENAVEHNPDPKPWVGLEVEHGTGQVKIRVHDDGPGIPQEEQRVLHEGVTPLSHGSSVGLWLVHWCVSTLGGDVDFDERDPRGSIITVTVPAVAEP